MYFEPSPSPKNTICKHNLNTTEALGDPTLDPLNEASLGPDGHQLSLITGLLAREREAEG